MPRRNKRDKRYEPKEYDNSGSSNYDPPVSSGKPKRKRKDKYDKQIYRESQ